MKDDTILLVGALAIGGYAVYRLLKPVEDTLSGVGTGLTTATTGAGAGVSNIATSAADAIDDVLSPLDIIGASSKKVTDFISSINPFSSQKGETTTKSPAITSAEFTAKAQAAADKWTSSYNPFINPTAQSIMPAEMSIYSPPMTIQNTTKLAKSSPSVAKILKETPIINLSPSISTTSTTARYIGGIGKSTVKKK